MPNNLSHNIAIKIRDHILRRFGYDFEVLSDSRDDGYSYLCSVIPPLGVVFIDFKDPFKGYERCKEETYIVLNLNDPEMFLKLDELMMEITRRIKEKEKGK